MVYGSKTKLTFSYARNQLSHKVTSNGGKFVRMDKIIFLNAEDNSQLGLVHCQRMKILTQVIFPST